MAVAWAPAGPHPLAGAHEQLEENRAARTPGVTAVLGVEKIFQGWGSEAAKEVVCCCWEMSAPRMETGK